ncbi:hypothetical protein [Deinococcus phoenicis]|nr:hypothetical protein [Deinococcus phoenicis]
MKSVFALPAQDAAVLLSCANVSAPVKPQPWGLVDVLPAGSAVG